MEKKCPRCHNTLNFITGTYFCNFTCNSCNFSTPILDTYNESVDDIKRFCKKNNIIDPNKY